MSTRLTNPVVDRAMRAAFEAWKREMLRTGKVRQIDARFEDIADRDRRLIELQCRAAIASLKEISGSHPVLVAGAQTMPDYDPGTDDAKQCLDAMIDTALTP